MSDDDINSEVRRADEEACGKLWEIYFKEAKEYDEGLVSSWKEDMDALLVFSGLYSAVLTAFIVESYQNLQEQPEDVSLVVLKQISSQLFASSQAANSTVTPEPLATFKPTASALVCNLLWFFSLGLALLCAILATFVQQWSRKFLHRTTIVKSPSNQAHLIQFLYFGLRDFRVHAIVDAIPALLHLSIFFFFSGLLAFLIDVNIILVYVIAIFLFTILSLYVFFTIHPIATLRSFFQTPLSPLIWRIWKSDFLRRTPRTGIFSLKGKSVSDPEKPGVGEQATAIHDETSMLVRQPMKMISSLQDAMLTAYRDPNQDHEIHSIKWTMQSINDDVELLPFVEALIDAVWGLDGPHTGNYYLIRPFLETNDPHFNIIQRVFSLLKNAQNPWFDDKHRKRCRVVGPKFFWIMAWIFLNSSDTFTLPKLPGMEARSITWFTSDIIELLVQLHTDADYDNTLDDDYASSAAALCALSMHKTIRQVEPDTTSMGNMFWCAQVKSLGPKFRDVLRRREDQLKRDLVQQLQPYLVAFDFDQYLKNALVHIPYQFDRTIDCFLQSDIKYPAIADDFPITSLTDQIERCSLGESTKRTPSLRELDHIFQVVCSFSEQHASAIVQYIAKRVEMGGWRATKDVWREEKALARFYDVIGRVGLADWDKDHFVAIHEVLKCIISDPISGHGFRPPIELLDLDTRFWNTYLSRYKAHFVDGGAHASPLATSLQIHVMIHFLYSNNHTLRSSHLLDHVHDNTQLHDFTQEYIQKAPKELSLVILMHICTDLGPKESPVQLRDALDFFLCFLAYSMKYSDSLPNMRLFELPGMLKEFLDFTNALADVWIREASVERLETLLLVWSIWLYLLSGLELSSMQRSELETLYGAGQMVLRPESKKMITQIKEQEAKPYKSWLEKARYLEETDLESLIEYVFGRLRSPPEKSEDSKVIQMHLVSSHEFA